MRTHSDSVYVVMDFKKDRFDVIAQLASLKRYARSLVRNNSDAEDLMHDALVKAYERQSTFRSGANLRNWLLSIIHNTHVDRLRSNRSRIQRETSVTVDKGQEYPPNQEDVVQLRQIKEAFMQLPVEQREALYLVAIEDLTYQQAAKTLEIPIGTLMSRISRARSTLRNFENGTARPLHLKIVGGGHG